MPYKNKEDRRRHDLENKDSIRGLHCLATRRRRLDCPETYHGEKLKQVERYHRCKIKVLSYYGGGRCACVKCGESRLACLSIDHLNGRLVVGHPNRRLSGRQLYRWLEINDMPDGYQTLCMNCQWVKRYENGETGGRVGE